MDRKHNRPLLLRRRGHRLTEENPRKVLVPEEWKKRPKTVKKKNLKGKCTDPSCDYWHPPVCRNYKSESGCKFGEKCVFRHTEVDSQPSRSRRRMVVKVLLPCSRIPSKWAAYFRTAEKYGKCRKMSKVWTKPHSTQKPHLNKNWKRIPCNTEHCVLIVVLGLSSNSGTSSSSTCFPQDSSSRGTRFSHSLE